MNEWPTNQFVKKSCLLNIIYRTYISVYTLSMSDCIGIFLMQHIPIYNKIFGGSPPFLYLRHRRNILDDSQQTILPKQNRILKLIVILD